MAGGLGTQQREDVQHHQVPYHSQAVCMLLTQPSSDGVTNKSDTFLIASSPGLRQPVQHWEMIHKSTRQGEDQLQVGERGSGGSVDLEEQQPVSPVNHASML